MLQKKRKDVELMQTMGTYYERRHKKDEEPRAVQVFDDDDRVTYFWWLDNNRLPDSMSTKEFHDKFTR